MIEFHAVFENVIRHEVPDWASRSDIESPFICLSNTTTHDQITSFIAGLCEYNHLTALSAHDAISSILLADALIISGGVAVFAGEQEPLYPSCCCGLESWREWFDSLTTGASPWWGHDPTPWLDIKDNVVNVWKDGGLSGNSSDERPYCSVSLHDCKHERKKIESEVRGFLESLHEWTMKVDASRADALVTHIDELMSLTVSKA